MFKNIINLAVLLNLILCFIMSSKLFRIHTDDWKFFHNLLEGLKIQFEEVQLHNEINALKYPKNMLPESAEVNEEDIKERGKHLNQIVKDFPDKAFQQNKDINHIKSIMDDIENRRSR